jgi:ribose 5-phosphate isomerase B
MRVAIGSDHAGFGYKEVLAGLVRELGHEVIDVGTFDREPADYPDYAEKVALTIRSGEADRGVLICGSAVGVCVAANKVPGVRAGVSHDTYSAHQGVEHDDMNVLCMGERVIGIELAREILRAFLSARYSRAERHQRRLDKVLAIEKTWMR